MVNKSFRRTNGAIATILLACLLSGWNMNKEEKVDIQNTNETVDEAEIEFCLTYKKLYEIEETIRFDAGDETVSETETIENPAYNEEELYVLSHVIYGESGNCSWEQQIYTGSVVLNRVNSNRYPDSIKDVVFDKGQYACTWDGNYDKKPSERSIEVAKYLLENGSQIPYYVLYQAEFKQGNEVWKQMGGYILLL